MKTAAAKSPWGSSPRKRDTQFLAKREAVLQVAARLFRERGYDGASLNEIAEILSITKPTLYYYVRNKDELILEIKKAAQQQVLEFIEEAMSGPGTGYEKLRSIMVKYALLMTTDFGVCLILVPPRSMESESRAMLYAGAEDMNHRLYRVLASGHADGSLVAPDPVITYHVLFGSLNWMGVWYKPGGRISPQELAEMQVDMLLDGIRPPQAKRAAAAPPARKRAPAKAAAKKQR